MSSAEEEMGSVIIEALLLSAQGQEQEAMQLLMSAGEENLSPAGLDLLARLSVQNGQIARSRALWHRALQRDPSFAPAKKALAKLDTPWLAKSMACRLSQLAGIACVIVLSVLGLFAVIAGVQNTSCPAGKSPRASSQLLKELATLSIPDCDIQISNNTLRIVFTDGLFRYRNVFAENAQDKLTVVAQSLKSVDPSLWLIVEGQAESYPVPPNRDFANNHELALARAIAVANVLSSKYGIPPGRIFATASDQPLFAEIDGIQPKNRTVVIKIIQPTD